jgi:hypothetical protein
MADSLPDSGNRTVASRLAAWLKQYWFPQTTTARLAVLRVLLAALVLLWFLDPLTYHLRRVQFNDGYDHPEGIIRVAELVTGGHFRTVPVITGVYWATVVGGILAAVGVLANLMFFVFALGYWLLVAHEYSYGEHHHHEAIFAILLMIMALAPIGRSLSLDSWLHRRRGAGPSEWGPRAFLPTAMWPVRTIQVCLAIGYFQAGLCKLLRGGIDWFNGYTLQWYMMHDGTWNEMPLGVWAARFHWPNVIVSYFSVAFELFFWVILFVPRLAPLFLLAGVAMHLGIYYTMKAPFFEMMAVYFVWVPFERLLFRQPDVPAAPLPA